MYTLTKQLHEHLTKTDEEYFAFEGKGIATLAIYWQKAA